MEEKVLQVLSDVLEVPRDILNSQTSQENLEAWDSMGHMNLIMALEEEFEVHFDAEDFIKLLSVENILNTLTEKSTS